MQYEELRFLMRFIRDNKWIHVEVVGHFTPPNPGKIDCDPDNIVLPSPPIWDVISLAITGLCTYDFTVHLPYDEDAEIDFFDQIRAYVSDIFFEHPSLG